MAKTESKEEVKKFKESDLNKEQLKQFHYVLKRIPQLQEARKEQYGTKLEEVWKDADRDYIPHRLNTTGKRVIATDEEKGWRGSMVSLGSSNWQSDIAQPNPFVKIQTALSILLDQNPTGVFTPASKKYQAQTELLRQLYQRSWQVAQSKEQLKLFVYNLAKYGWAIGRTYPLNLTRKVKVLTEYNQEDPESSVYEDKEVSEYNDIFRENLDPWNAWIDDMKRPNNKFTLRDWAFRKVYPLDSFKEEFAKYKRCELVKAGGITTEKIDGTSALDAEKKEEELVEVYFYENRIKDLFMVIANGVPVVIEPLPISDANGNKKLSCWETYWNIRHAECPYGIGIYEAIRYDNALLDRVSNMGIDQLTMSIYKMFFYTGTQSLNDTGVIKIEPGVGKQVLNPKDINWLEVPGPGAEYWKGLEFLKTRIDESSGITDPLVGEITGKTAFELAQAKESALKRMKTPLDNILDALNTEGYITISLIDLLYSLPETYAIADPMLIDDYLNEIGSDPDLYGRDEDGTFVAKVYPEFPLNLEEDEKGNLVETQETKFFRVKPKHLKWDGIIAIKSQSVLTPSKQIDKALELEMYNMLIPLLVQPPEIYNKIAKSIVRLYDKDPRDLLPAIWLAENPMQEQPLIVPEASLQQEGQQAAQAPKAVSSVQASKSSTSLPSQIASRVTQGVTP